MFSNFNEEVQSELIAFVEKEERDKSPKPLKVSLVAELMRQIVLNEREITGMVTNRKTGDVFGRFSLTPDEKEWDRNGRIYRTGSRDGDIGGPSRGKLAGV